MPESSPTSSERSVEALLLLVVFIWAANAPLAKFGISGLDVFVFNGIRYVVAAIALTSIMFFRSEWKTVGRKEWPSLIALGLLANVIYQLAYIVGLKNTSVGNSVILLSTSPLWTAFFEARIHKETISRRTWLATTISLGGIILIVLGSGTELGFGSNALRGDVLSLIAALLWALNTNYQKKFLKSYSAIQLSVILIGVGAVGLTAVALPSAMSMSWGDIGIEYYLAAVASGALSIAAANVLWTFGVKRIGPRRTSAFNNLVPVLAIVLAYATLGEKVSVLQIAGATVTLIGVWFARH